MLLYKPDTARYRRRMETLPNWMRPPRPEGWFAEDLDNLPEAPEPYRALGRSTRLHDVAAAQGVVV